MNLKQIALIIGIIGAIAGGAWAMDARIDAKVTLHVAPLKEDVKAIRHLLEAYILRN